MQPDFKSIAALTFRDPRDAAERLLHIGLPMPVIWLGLAIVTTATAVLQGLNTLVVPTPAEFPAFFGQPVLYAAIMWLSTVVTVALMTGIGRMLNGQGRYPEVLLLLVWLQGIYAILQAVTFLMLFVSPFLAAIGSIGVLLWAMYLSVIFLDEVHGFRSISKSILTLFLTVVAAFILMLILMPIFGYTPPEQF